jgi:MFS family permease
MTRPPIWDETKRWWALSALVICILVIGLDTTVLYVALPELVESLQTTNSELQWVFNSYLLVFAGLMLPFGAFADRVGRKRMLFVGLIVFGLASAGATIASEPAGLITARAFMGVGAAIIMPVSLSMLSVLFAPEERARALAIWSAGVALGLPIGPLAGGWLLEHYWWGSVFMINIPIVLMALIAGWWLFPESRDATAGRLDLPGAILCTTGLVTTTYAVTEAQTLGWLDTVTVSSFTAGIVLIGFFVLWELRAARLAANNSRLRTPTMFDGADAKPDKGRLGNGGRHRALVDSPSPMMDLGLFADRRFTQSTIVLTLVYFALMGFLFVLTPYLQAVRGATSLGTGVQLLPLVGALMVGALTADLIAKHTGPRGPVTLGMVLVGAGLLLFGRADADTESGYLAACLVIIGVGVGLTLATALHAALSSLPDSKAGVGSGVTSAFRQIGGAFGVAILGSVLGSAYRDEMQPAVAGLPEPLAAAAGDEVGTAIQISRSLGPAGISLQDAAQNAYAAGMEKAVLVGSAVAFAAAVIALIGMPKARKPPTRRHSRHTENVPVARHSPERVTAPAH